MRSFDARGLRLEDEAIGVDGGEDDGGDGEDRDGGDAVDERKSGVRGNARRIRAASPTRFLMRCSAVGGSRYYHFW